MYVPTGFSFPYVSAFSSMNPQSVWVQDFPPLTKPIVGRDATASAFSTTLQMVLTKLNVPDALSALRSDHPCIPMTRVEDLGRQWKFGNAKVRSHLLPSPLQISFSGWPPVTFPATDGGFS